MEYDNILPKTFCESTRLSSGNTETTVKHMKSWVENYHRQTVKLSTILKKRTLAQTIDSIYQFLYHHIQYKADATDQLLSSPACCWYKRSEGIDCKSYSIFASCILNNLGIPHYIRKVTQPNHYPDQYTHVYIIVPKDGKSLHSGYHVIDATKHENTEVEFIKSKDVFMSGLPHFGLNGAAVNRTVGVPVTQTAKEGLENYLLLLSRVGVHPAVIKGIREEVYNYLNAGIDPRFKIYRHGVIVNRKRFLFENLTGLNRAGSSLRSAKYVIRELAGNHSGLGNPDSSTSDPNQDNGQDLEEVTQVVLESNWFKDTFGAIFANGFNFSCWGSSYSPSKAKKHVEVDMPFIVQWSGLLNNINRTTLSKFLELCALYRIDSINGQKSKFAKCTREGHKIRQRSVDALEKEILDQVKQNYILTPTIKIKGNLRLESGLPGYGAGSPYYWNNPYFYQGYNVQLKPNSSGGDISVPDNNGGNDSGGGIITNPGGGDILNPVNPINPVQPVQAGINPTTGILIGAAVLGTVFMPQIKKAISNKKTKTKK